MCQIVFVNLGNSSKVRSIVPYSYVVVAHENQHRFPLGQGVFSVHFLMEKNEGETDFQTHRETFHNSNLASSR